MMSARNYLSAREKRDCLPSIGFIGAKNISARSELPAVSANTSRYNRNINYSYVANHYHVNSIERAGTPFSDFFSDSETGTPDIHSEESDSSAGSALRRSNAEATRILLEEWHRIERTLYDEDGEKSTRPQIIEECKQWRALHPQLRIVGKAIQLPEKRAGFRPVEYDEVVVMHYSDYSEYESDDRLSQSSTDVTPQNSPRVSICEYLSEPKVSREKITEDLHEPKLSREKISILPQYGGERELPDSFCSLLHITPLQIRSPSQRKRQNPSILKSELASSRWMKNSRADSSLNCDRNSAKSFVSLDTRNYGNLVLSASEQNKKHNRGMTARHRDLTRLEPLYTPELPPSEMSKFSNGMSYPYNMRKVSLPPLLLEEEKKKVSTASAKKPKTRKNVPRSSYMLDKMRHYNK